MNMQAGANVQRKVLPAHGNSRQALVEEVEAVDADFLVVGSHTGKKDPTFLGSVALYSCRHVRCACIVVK
jgi:nucleotide-binding universal stress UspA family protein